MVREEERVAFGEGRRSGRDFIDRAASRQIAAAAAVFARKGNYQVIQLNLTLSCMECKTRPPFFAWLHRYCQGHEQRRPNPRVSTSIDAVPNGRRRGPDTRAQVVHNAMRAARRGIIRSAAG
jgi:hypothetical protein